MIYTLSQYQIGYLGNLFSYAEPYPAHIKIEHIGIIQETGEMIVEYKKYGFMTSETISRNPPAKPQEP